MVEDKKKMGTGSLVMMILLGVISVLIPFIILIIGIVCNMNNGFFKILESFTWCFYGLPITLLCFILGIVFTCKKHLGCIACIIIGLIMSISLIGLGCIGLIPFKSMVSSTVDNYVESLGIDIPSLDYVDNFNIQTENGETTAVIEFNSKVQDEFLNDIGKENNWLMVSSVSDICSKILPSDILYYSNDYVIIYNVTTDSFVRSSDEFTSGKYTIVLYNEDKNKLTIYSNDY